MSQKEFDIHKAVVVKFRTPRGCGFRKAGGLYLCGHGVSRECDRGFLIIKACPVCGERPRFTRGIAKIDFVQLFGEHKPPLGQCKDPPNCVVCHPRSDMNHYLMWVGRDYTMTSFVNEATAMGVSKRIAKIPSDFVVGRDWVYLARKSVKAKTLGIKLEGKKRVVDVIFYAFKPLTIEYILKNEDLDNEKKIKDLVSRGITPVLEVDRPDRE
jgi:hypothetical protein